MIVASWILTVISYITGVGLILVGTVFTNDVFFIILGAIAFLLFGFIGHILVSKKKSQESIGKGGMAVYILSFPQFILPFAIFFVLLLVLKLLDWVIFIFTDHHYVAQFVDYMMSILLGKPRASVSSATSDGDAEEYREVLDDYGNHLQLRFLGRSTDYDSYSPYAHQDYLRYRDNLGKYWRSYDGKHVIEEKKVEQAATNNRMGIN